MWGPPSWWLLPCALVIWWWRRYSAAAVREFLELLDGWDGEIKEALAYVDAAVARARIAKDFPLEVDVVCSGGGFKVLYAAGALMLLRRYGVVTRRVAGASAGSLLGFMHWSNGLVDGLRWSFSFGEMLLRRPLAHPGPYWELFFRRQCLRLRALPRPGDLTVSLTRVKRYLPPRGANERVSAFESREDLFTTLMASGSVPLITCALLGRRHRGARAIDGGVTDNAPLFVPRAGDGDDDDDDAPPQLVLRYKTLEARWQGRVAGVVFSPREMLEVFKAGVDDAAAFLAVEGHLDGGGGGDARPFAGRLELIRPVVARKRGVDRPEVGFSTLLSLAARTYSMDGLSSLTT